ncbi:uncharacterized protein LOC114075174 isoform X2 [Solanum pennellii]|uniref:Uncharacterized protein LOC114075174 isoform X2 n=1 Tax=Solanum pennellii TaxID=28526 RepID=A0ABM1V0K0_SOLPN|nr:uncharacterized protein LOC114075174 isoform X2 [Solanum pennellii]
MEEEMLRLELESMKKKLDSWGRELNKLEALTKRETKKFEEDNKQVHDKLELKKETLFLVVKLDRFSRETTCCQKQIAACWSCHLSNNQQIRGNFASSCA